MQMRQAQVTDGAERIVEHFIRFRREARDQVGAEHGVGTRLPCTPNGLKSIGAAVATFHALEDGIVHRLQTEMQMRHQPGLFCEQAQQAIVNGRRVERAETQPLKLRRLG